MSSLEVHVLKTHELLSMQDLWNDLWQRSQTTLPTSRAEFLALWRGQFAPDQEIQAIVVEDSGRWISALPIVGKRWAKVIPTGTVPRNDWLLAGNLLLDEMENAAGALALIAGVLNKLPWTIYRFSLIASNESSWNQLRDTLSNTGFQIESRPSHEVAVIPIQGDWKSYQGSWSKNHRKNMARTIRRLEEQGRVRVNRYVPGSMTEAEPLLQRAFALEDSGWKGQAGSSILRSPGMPQFMKQLAELLIHRQELELMFLELNDQPLAVEFLWNTKQTLHSYKVAYDEAFEKLNPGQILMQEILRDLFDTGRCSAYDCMGPISTATEKWCGNRYQISQWTFAPRRSLSRAVLFAYQKLRRPPSRPMEMGVTNSEELDANEDRIKRSDDTGKPSKLKQSTGTKTTTMQNL